MISHFPHLYLLFYDLTVEHSFIIVRFLYYYALDAIYKQKNV